MLGTKKSVSVMSSNKPVILSNMLGAKGVEASMVEQVLTHPTISIESMTRGNPAPSTLHGIPPSMLEKSTKSDDSADYEIMLVVMVQSSTLEEQLVARAKAVETLANCDKE